MKIARFRPKGRHCERKSVENRIHRETESAFTTIPRSSETKRIEGNALEYAMKPKQLLRLPSTALYFDHAKRRDTYQKKAPARGTYPARRPIGFRPRTSLAYHLPGTQRSARVLEPGFHGCCIRLDEKRGGPRGLYCLVLYAKVNRGFPLYEYKRSNPSHVYAHGQIRSMARRQRPFYR